MLKTHAPKSVILIAIAIALALFLPVRAAADDDDPPSRVARLSYAQGSVSFQPAGTDDWVSSVVNRPVTIGDKLWSDNDGRVELQLDGSLVRLSRNTGISFLNLSDNVTQIQISEGTVVVRVRRLDNDETYEVDTPNLAFSILRPGFYRITVDEQGQTTAIKVHTGEGEVTGGGSAYTVHAKEYFSFSGNDQLYVNQESYHADDDQFDTWSADRDAHWAHSRSAQYVSPDVVGYEDLDDHGDWNPTPEYGNVWFPRTRVAGWAPYHYGHWAYIEPWGYTWVDDEPWGFAPFHYGRWVSVRGRWGWVPSPPRSEGVVYVRPVYAPALVAWVGVGGGGAGVAWFALGPREVYVPSYHVSRGYVDRVNVSNTRVETTVINNYYNTTIVNKNVTVTNVTYVNQRVPGAVAATSSQAFTTSQPVARNALKIDERAVSRAPVRAFTPAEVPAKQAVLGTGRANAVARPPAAIEARAVVAKAPPPPPPPAFERRQEAIKNNGGRPLSTAQVRQIQPAPAAQVAPVKIAPPAKAATPAQNAPAAQTGRAPNNPPPAGKPMQTQPDRPGMPPVRTETTKPGAPPARPDNRPDNPPAGRPAAPNNAAEPPVKQTPPNNATQPQDRPQDRPDRNNRNAEPPAKQVAPDNTAQPKNGPPDRPAANNNAGEPPAKPVTPNNAERPQDRRGDRPATNDNAVQPQNRPSDRPAANNNAGEPPAKPVTPNNAERPQDRRGDRPATNDNAVQPQNRPSDRPSNPNDNPRRPDANKPTPLPARTDNAAPAAKPAPANKPNPQLEQRHQQEQAQLQEKQQQERQKIQQQQDAEKQRLAQQKADEAQKQNLQQQHQLQVQELQQKHAQEQQQLQQKQQKEKQQTDSKTPPKGTKDDRPPSDRP